MQPPAKGAENNYLVLVKSPDPSRPPDKNVVKENPILVKGKKYEVTTAKVGVPIYIDREYKIAGLSWLLDGSILIRTACNDKTVATPEHLKFTLTAPATVYVAYDKRCKPPAWLTDPSWTIVHEVITCPNVPTVIYAKQFLAGPVALGGNHEPPATGDLGHYLVLVKPK